MANHRTCRFQNTFNDLYDGVDFLKSNGIYNAKETLNMLSETEKHYALKLRELCQEYLELVESEEEEENV